MTLVLAWLLSSLVGFASAAVNAIDAWWDWENQRTDPLYTRNDLIDRTARDRLQSRAVLFVLPSLWVACGLLALLLHDGHTGQVILWGLVAGNALQAGESLWFKIARLRRQRVARRPPPHLPPPTS